MVSTKSLCCHRSSPLFNIHCILSPSKQIRISHVMTASFLPIHHCKFYSFLPFCLLVFKQCHTLDIVCYRYFLTIAREVLTSFCWSFSRFFRIRIPSFLCSSFESWLGLIEWKQILKSKLGHISRNTVGYYFKYSIKLDQFKAVDLSCRVDDFTRAQLWPLVRNVIRLASSIASVILYYCNHQIVYFYLGCSAVCFFVASYLA